MWRTESVTEKDGVLTYVKTKDVTWPVVKHHVLTFNIHRDSLVVTMGCDNTPLRDIRWKYNEFVSAAHNYFDIYELERIYYWVKGGAWQ